MKIRAVNGDDRATVEFMETCFADQVPKGKLQAQLVGYHWAKESRAPRLLNTPRRYLPEHIMIKVVSGIRGAIQGPLELNARLLRTVIKAVIIHENGGKYLRENGGEMALSPARISKLMAKLNVKYKRASTHSQKLCDDWEEQGKTMRLTLVYTIWRHGVPPELVVNADHAGIMVLNTKGYAYCTSRNKQETPEFFAILHAGRFG